MIARPVRLLPIALLSLTSCVIHVDDGDWSTSWGDNHGPKIRGNGVRSEESRDVGAFGAIHTRGSFDVDVEVRPGSAYSVRLFGDENILPHVKTFVEDDNLRLEMERGRYSMDERLYVEITVPELAAFKLYGSGDITVSGLDNASFEAHISGSGDFRASGRTDSLRASISGSGDMHLSELEARDASVSISGSGDIMTFASEHLRARVSGSGDIRYKGRPTTDGHVSGSGSIRRVH